MTSQHSEYVSGERTIEQTEAMCEKNSGGTKKLHNDGEMKETAHQEVTRGGERDEQKEGEVVTVLSRALVFLLMVTVDIGGGGGGGGSPLSGGLAC